MSEYVSRSIVMVDGTRLQDVKAFEEGEFQHAKTVQTMDGQGSTDITGDQTINFDYVIPKVGARRDWTEFNGKRISRAYKGGGSKTTYTNVKLLSEGAERCDNENEVVRNYVFAYEERIFE